MRNEFLPTVRWDRDESAYKLHGESGITVGTPEWFVSLAEIACFNVETRDGFTYHARSENRRGSVYWYAYKKLGGKLYKEYLGKTVLLTGDVLNKAAHALGPGNIAYATASHNPQDARTPQTKKPARARKLYSATAIDNPPVAHDETRRYTRLQAACILDITPSQFDYIKEKQGIQHVDALHSGKYNENFTYLYSADSINEMARHIKKRRKRPSKA
ncbi:MAG: hypothetical protein ABI947_01035 [Chloroflexota bacterium]